ncbi:metal ABC transporter permease [Effusibacillus consociatus]|uniref:Metal ABC transporter permease n=1 Tax=Effusibacillus consociatus TaxID=1117041 RepID=A0ABV9Q1P8_9BACL
MSDTGWILLTGSLVAASCAFLGCFLILRKMAMLGDAISHAVLPGIVIAFLVSHNMNSSVMLIGAAALGLLTAFLVQTLHQSGVQSDAAIGVTFTALFAVGVVLVSVFARDVHLDLEHVLYGEIAFVPWNTLEINGIGLGPRAVWMVGGTFLISLLVVGFFYKEFKICSFDPAMAAAVGIPVLLIHYLMMGLVSLTTVAAFESVGAVLVVAMLIVPGATAYLLTDRLSVMLGLSMLIGVMCAILGYYLASFLDASIAGSMTTIAGIVFALTLVFSPSHGLLSRWFARRRMQQV